MPCDKPNMLQLDAGDFSKNMQKITGVVFPVEELNIVPAVKNPTTKSFRVDSLFNPN